MKQWLTLMALLGILVPGMQVSSRGAETNQEQQLIKTLQSKCTLQEKDAACAQLKRIGTARSVPALAALLTDEQLSHSARYALESMPLGEAGRALTDALARTSGATRVGLIHSLGARGETLAVPALVKLLADSDPGTAAAAATALGRIGGPAALKALQAATKTSAGQVHDAVVDAILRCADRLLASGGAPKARGVFEQLYDSEKRDYVRVAAYRGMVQASGSRGLKLLIRAIAGQPGPSRTAALQLVREVQARNATRAFAKLLPEVEPPVQVALIEGLHQRRDPAAAPAITELLTSRVAEVRLAAIHALGLLGDTLAVPALAESAAAATGEEQKAARQALVELRRGKVTEMLLEQLTTASPAVQAELARALGDRGDVEAVPRLQELARLGSDSVQKAALQALGSLTEEGELAALVQLVLEAGSEAARSEAAEALNVACQRLQAKRSLVHVEPLVKGLEIGSREARVALLPVCSGLPIAQVRVALRTAVEDSDAQIRTAAIRALCDTTDAELLPDLVSVVRGAPDEKLRSLAIGGCVRLTTQEEAARLANAQRVAPFKAILGMTLRADQKRLALAGLAEIPDPEALKLAEPLLEDAEVQTEAARAVIKLAAALAAADSQASIAALKKAVAAPTDAATRQAAETALKEVEANADYITAWQAAGPYRQADKDYAALFDIAFPPEAADARDVKWQNLPASADLKRPWVMDLLKTFGGEQCVAYARTWIHSDQSQTARLELGSDDGVKVWLNRKLVHAQNVARPLQAGSDKVEITLNPGWNLLLLKITQNNQGWEFCARVLKPDGSHLDGLQFEAPPKNL